MKFEPHVTMLQASFPSYSQYTLVLGPILFLIFINDLDYGIRNWILKFADDTKIFGKINTTEDHINLQRDLDKLVQTVVRGMADGVQRG